MKFSNKEPAGSLPRCFNSPQGKKFLRFEVVCRMDATTFDPDPGRMAYKEGHRAVVLEIDKL